MKSVVLMLILWGFSSLEAASKAVHMTGALEESLALQHVNILYLGVTFRVRLRLLRFFPVMATERTPILISHRPSTTFSFNNNRVRWKNFVRPCIWSSLIFVTGAMLLTSIFYSTINNQRDINEFEDAFNMFNVTWPLRDEIDLFRNDTIPESNDLDNAVSIGLKSLTEREAYEERLPKMDRDSPSYRHQVTMKATDRAKELIRFGYILEMGTRELAKSKFWGRQGGSLSLRNTRWLPDEVCVREPAEYCPPSPYRTPDGSCNNLLNPKTWGVAMHPFRRLLSPDYSDGISAPRKSSDGDLPTAREVSLKIHRAFYIKDLDFTVMLAVWGQFIDHDMTATALSQGLNGEAIACCGNEDNYHPECFVVKIRKGDPFYEKYNTTCMDFVRSAPAPLCRFGPREQLNQASSFIDGSAIYGSSKSVMDSLRSFNNGELKMLRTPTEGELLPISTDVNDGCNREEQFKRGRYCFLTGDLRSNENLHLVSMHLIFARQHNFIARNLSSLNPRWDDEKVFQEARRIVIAQLQHITYGEFLPIVIPRNLMDYLNLTLQTRGYFDKYNPTVNPTIANSFAACVFRFGHSLLPGLMKLISNDSDSEEYIELHKMLFNPFSLYDNDFLEKTIRGALQTPVEKNDVYFSREVTAKLFQNGEKNGPCGLDLVSLNIQRGRDHGLPGYTKWRIPCGLKAIESFDDLENIFDSTSLTNIRNQYESVNDIDFFTGGLAEIPTKGSLLGPTFTCLMADQFFRLKTGDRYWYENQEKPQAFTPEQLRQLRKTSLARIICDNSNITVSQPLVMKRVGEGNRRKFCDDIPNPNWEAWKDDRFD